MTLTIRRLASLGFAIAAPAMQAAEPIDVLVLYTDEAAASESGRDMNARIASYIEYSNQAYRNSDVDIELRLVGAERLDAPYRLVSGDNLNALRGNREVARLRQEYGADLVTLINQPQAMGGGYVCGIAYQPGGNADTGRFYSNAAGYGFSLVGVGCGYNTFTHELGHNLSLGHSYVQNSSGSVYGWGRGHGVQGLFSTIMAYPQAYGTRNHLQQFSSPGQQRCEGLPCGVDTSQPRGADAATALNRLAPQVADFVPTVDLGAGGGDDSPGDDSGGDNGSGDGGNLPLCEKPELADNLLAGGDFNDLSAWSSFYNAASLTTGAITADCGRDNQLRVSSREAYYGGPVQDLTGILEAGARYRISALLGLAGTNTRDAVRVTLQLRDASGTRYQNLRPLSVTGDGLSRYDETFTVEAGGNLTSARLMLHGPEAGVDFIADEVLLVRAGDPSEPDPDTGPELLVDEDFESGGQGWSGYMGTWVYRTSRAASDGNFGLRSTARSAWYSGPGFSAQGVLAPGERYQASVDVYLRNAARASDTVGLWAWYVDAAGAHWQNLGSQDLATQNWARLDTEFRIDAEGPLTQLRLHVMGPAPDTSLVIDNLRVRR